ncbi:MAG: DNA recombination protein RmuC [Clostridia bacterium]|nr:DNA recombination protein RmuC [Clostridia bacterium]
MDNAILILSIINLVIALSAVSGVILLIIKKEKRGGGLNEIRELLDTDSKTQMSAFSNILSTANNSLIGGIKLHTDTQSKEAERIERRLNESITALETRQDAFAKNIDYKFDSLKTDVSRTLADIRGDNAAQLEKMRSVVEEKLQTTLETRLTQSFGIISDRLEKVHEGLNEMRNLSQNVTDLKKVFGGVKTRGMWGEVALGALLEQIMVKEQYETNFAIGRNREVVEYAIILPGREEGKVYLPIDAKFPIEDYQRLVDASEKGEKEVVENMSRELEKRIKTEARTIRDKYIKPPLTTDFAVLYLPIEGLFAEMVKRSGLQEHLQHNYNVLLAGPTTLTALLTSLQMGFKTVAIEKRSREIWILMAEFKREFMRFSELLDKTEKQMDTATGSIRKANERTLIIKKKLGKVELLDDAAEELETGEGGADEDTM